jgi:AcrR family transcriptional regulator
MAEPITPTPERERLLRLAADYVLDHGVSELSLRRLGQAIGTNNRMLLYYFGSKEKLISAALGAASHRFPAVDRAFVALAEAGRPLAERITAAWEAMAQPANLPFHRLFFEVLGLAAYQRGQFDTFLRAVGTQWREQTAATLRRDGVPEPVAGELAQELIALWRGLQLDLITTGDRAAASRVNAAAAAALSGRAAAAIEVGGVRN